MWCHTAAILNIYKQNIYFPAIHYKIACIFIDSSIEHSWFWKIIWNWGFYWLFKIDRKLIFKIVASICSLRSQNYDFPIVLTLYFTQFWSGLWQIALFHKGLHFRITYNVAVPFKQWNHRLHEKQYWSLLHMTSEEVIWSGSTQFIKEDISDRVEPGLIPSLPYISARYMPGGK